MHYDCFVSVDWTPQMLGSLLPIDLCNQRYSKCESPDEMVLLPQCNSASVVTEFKYEATNGRAAFGVCLKCLQSFDWLEFLAPPTCAAFLQ